MNSSSSESTFADACQAALASAYRSLGTPEDWKTYLNSGSGEQAVAGDHQGRHLLELLQNARDAVYEGHEAEPDVRGRVLIGVTERGLIVANSGMPFALHDKKVREAVQYLNRSSKDKPGFIGHKGIGLKSVLLKAGSFHVRSWVEGSVLRAVFARSRTARELLPEFARELPEIHGLAREGDRARARLCEDPWSLLADLPRLPLFLQPHLDEPDSCGADGGLLEDLLVDGAPHRNRDEGLDDEGNGCPLVGYRTVVYLPYSDPEWEQLLRQLEPLIPAEHSKLFEDARSAQSHTQPGNASAKMWKEVSGLDPRILMLLGEVDEIQLCRYTKGVLREAIRYDLGRPLHARKTRRQQDVDVSCLRGRVRGKPQLILRRFRVFSRKLRSEPEPIRAVVEIPPVDPPADWLPSFEQVPLCLYYPIENAGLQLPVMLHGPFRVNSSRTDLAEEDKHNSWVLDEALKVLGKELPTLPGGRGLGAYMPWLVAPAGDLGQPKRDFLVEFRKKFERLLRESALVPTDSGARSGNKVLFNPDRSHAFEVLPKGLRLSLNSAAVFRRLRYRNRVEAWTAARSLGLGDILEDATGLERALLAAWKGYKPRQLWFPVTPDAGKEWFETLQQALKELLESDEAGAVHLAESMGSHQIPLIPARRGHGGRQMVLVRAERRKKTEKARRVVFWRSPETSHRTKKLPSPPGEIAVFLCEEADLGTGTWALTRWYQPWGTTKLESIRDLLLRVADQHLGRSVRETVEALPWLRARLKQARDTDKSLLRAEPGAWRGWGPLEGVPYWSNDQANAQRRRYAEAVRLGALMLPAAGSGAAEARDLVFGPEWAPLFEERLAGSHGERWATAIRAYGRFQEINQGKGMRRLAPPGDSVWRPAGDPARLLDILMVLGVQVGPPVRWRWVRKHGQPATSRHHEGSYTVKQARQLYAEGPQEPMGDLEPAMAAWRKTLELARNHPALSSKHSDSCPALRPHALHIHNYPFLRAFCWFPDLAALAMGWSAQQADAWVESLHNVWPELNPRILKTAWLCDGYHGPYGWKRDVPSLAQVQLAESAIWRCRSLKAQIQGQRLPAVVMARWPADEESAKETDPRRVLPALSEDMEHEFAAHLGIRLPAEFSPAPALRRLSWILKQSAVGDVTQETPFLLERQGTRSAWVGAMNQLTRQLWAGLEAPELSPESEPEKMWRLRDLGMYAGYLRGSKPDDGDWALPLVHLDGQTRLAASPLIFTRNPTHRDLNRCANRYVLEAPPGARAEMIRLAELLQVPRRGLLSAEPFPEEQAASPRERAALAEMVRQRLHLILGILRTHNRDNLDEAASLLLARLAGMIGIDGPGPDGRTSGLTASKLLAYSRTALPTGDVANGAYILAPGIADLLNQPGAAMQIDSALSAEADRVERYLLAQGVPVDRIIADVETLREERERRTAERRECATRWWNQLVPGMDPPAGLLKAAGAVVDELGRRRLLGMLIGALRELRNPAISNVLSVAAVLQGGDLVPEAVPAMSLSTPADSALDMLGRLLALHRCGDSMDSSDLSTALSESRDVLLDLAGLESSERVVQFQRGVGLLPVLGEASWLVEWSTDDWQTLHEAARGQLLKKRDSATGSRQRLLSVLIDAATIEEARLTLSRARRESEVELLLLERRFDQGDITFPEEAFTAPGRVDGITPADVKPIEPGRGTGSGGRGVSANQQLRGRIAERFVLEDCWRRFVALGSKQREILLEAVLACRNNRDTSVPWGTGTHAESLTKGMKTHWRSLTGNKPGDSARAYFRDLIEVAGERGPGFDVLDPFGVRDGGNHGVQPLRVEVKAVLPGDAYPRIVLTTNEYHMARLDPASYVLRVIEVPEDTHNLAGVRLVMDVLDPVKCLGLRNVFLVAVSGGQAGIRVRVGG